MVVTSLLNGSKVKIFKVNSLEELLNHAKDMGRWEERFYKMDKDVYHVSGRGIRIRKLDSNRSNGMGRFDDLLPPD